MPIIAAPELGVSLSSTFTYTPEAALVLGLSVTVHVTRVPPKFHDVRLPEDVEKGAHGGPNFSTALVIMSSGQEQRNIDWEEARSEFEVGYGISDKEDFQVFQKFFWARRGRGYGFRFKDWSDFEGTDEFLGTGTGTETDFELRKVYDLDGPLPYVRRITRPVEDTIEVTVNDVVVLPADYTIVYTEASGLRHCIVRFDSPVTGVVRATYEFDVPVRFDTDKFDLTLEHFLAGEVPSLSIVETRE